MICKKCKKEIDNKAVVCVHCGCKIHKPIYRKWWFWFIIAIVIILAASSSSEEKTQTASSQNTIEVSKTPEEVITYEVQDLETMIDELKSNALKAEKKYQDSHIEINGRISNFDSDGKYINVKPANAGEWDFESAMCYIKNEEQKNILIEKNVGDMITIKGKVKSIGEVIGYSIDIAEVQ